MAGRLCEGKRGSGQGGDDQARTSSGVRRRLWPSRRRLRPVARSAPPLRSVVFAVRCLFSPGSLHFLHGLGRRAVAAAAMPWSAGEGEAGAMAARRTVRIFWMVSSGVSRRRHQSAPHRLRRIVCRLDPVDRCTTGCPGCSWPALARCRPARCVLTSRSRCLSSCTDCNSASVRAWSARISFPEPVAWFPLSILPARG